jgi:transposase-like protein
MPKQLAAELGCSEQTLAAWRRQDEADRSALVFDDRARSFSMIVHTRRDQRWCIATGRG